MGHTVSQNVDQSPSNDHRFLNIDKEPIKMLPSVGDYKKLPLVSLEQAVSPLVSFVPDVKQMVEIVKAKCKNPADNLTIDESASIMLYSLEWIPTEKSFYIILNKTLCDKNRQNLKKWLSYLKLFTTALSKIPSTKGVVYCGVKKNLHQLYPQGKEITWWRFSSCITSLETLQSEEFLGENGTRTVFRIECYSGKNIQSHSFYSTRNEIILSTEVKFKITLCHKYNNDVWVIYLKEIIKCSSSSISSALSTSANSVQSSASTNSSAGQKNQNNINVTTKIQTAGPAQMNTNSSWFNWIQKIFNDPNADPVVTRRSQINYPALFELRRPCPRCHREDRVYRGDLLSNGDENDVVGYINAIHILFLPRLTSFISATGLIRFSSFIYVCPTLTIFSCFVPFFRFLSGRNRWIVASMCIGSVSYMLYRLIIGILALKDDIESGECNYILTYHIANKSRFCFFRSAFDFGRYIYICTYEH